MTQSMSAFQTLEYTWAMHCYGNELVIQKSIVVMSWSIVPDRRFPRGAAPRPHLDAPYAFYWHPVL